MDVFECRNKMRPLTNFRKAEETSLTSNIENNSKSKLGFCQNIEYL